MDHDISPLHALQLWLSGEIPKHYTIWGHQLIFWDRLGQVMEFVGALAVLVDLFDQRLGEDPDAKPLEPSSQPSGKRRPPAVA